MKTILTFLILWFCQNILFSQETVEISLSNRKEDSKEVYNVLKSDNSIKHGSYLKYIDNKLYIKCTFKNNLLEGEWLEYFENGVDIKTEGYYINGLKSALWTEFFPNNEGFYTQGKYVEGLKDKIWIENYQNSTFQRSKKEYDKSKKVGIWEFHDTNGELLKKYDYNTKTLLFYKIIDIKEQFKNIDSTAMEPLNDTITSLEVDIEGQYLPNMTYYSIDLMKNFNYPLIAIEEGLQGKCYIRFIITKNGEMKNLSVLKGVAGCPECDKEAIRVFKLSEDNWIPAIKNGKAVNSYYHAAISFKLE